MILNRNVSRLEAFSDAIFGFAATLLVVSLDPPASYAALIANVRGFAAFGVSFAWLVLLWVAHNAYFRRYEIEDATVIVLNSIFLFVVVFYVYPLRYAANTAMAFFFGGTLGVGVERLAPSELATMFALFGAGWTAALGCIALLHLHAARRRDALGLDELGAFDAVTAARHYFGYALVGLVSIALALGEVGVTVGAPGWVYGLMGPISWWNGAARARARAALAPGDLLVAHG
ncbi:MAG TPA: TMEM175 family protein [Gemmatimonadaceae bacterium]|nr:TMEM175 family protein [Gemmatimonadaceae bacterium]